SRTLHRPKIRPPRTMPAPIARAGPRCWNCSTRLSVSEGMPVRLDDLGAVRRDQPAYDETRRNITWNKRFARARAPDAIVTRCSADEVAAAIRIAIAKGVKVSPRGSGHHFEAAALRD